MKKVMKVFIIFLFSAFLLLPLKTYAAESVWSQDLDLTDSVSSSIAKVEDGVVVMQYEGAASKNNLLIKYDFNGKKIWTINNDYGYNMQEVSDGFIVWSEEKITKFDKDKNILWSKDIALEPTDANDGTWRSTDAGLGGKLIELSDYYIVYQVHYTNKLRNDIFCIDKNGNIVQRISINDFLTKNNISSNDFWIMSIDVLSDNNFILVYKTDYGNSKIPLHIAEVTSDFVIIKDNEYQYYLSAFDIRSVVSTDKGYIVLGENVIYLLNDGNIKTYQKVVLDVIKKDEYIYTYEFSDGDDVLYDAYIVKYNMDMEEQDIIKLPLSSEYLNNYSGLAQLKNRFILKDENNVIALNTPMLYIAKTYHDMSLTNCAKVTVNNGSYSLARYRFAEEKDDVQEENKDSDSNLSEIINNIIKNPETNSIIIIVVFVVLTLVISIVSYFLYKKKNKKIDVK